jgi:hypothetical protein
MILSNSIVLGFLRFFVMFLFLYLINKKWINKSSSNNFVEFVVLQWFKYGAILGIIIFITIQLNIFDLLNTLFILALLITIELIGIQNLKNPFLYFNSKIKNALIKRLKKIEISASLKSWFSIKKKETTSTNNYFLYYLIAFAILLTFVSRFYFLKYDFYLLSNSWNSDLETMFNLDNQFWFFPNNTIIGELAYTNFYAKIFDVSPEIALQSMGIFESILLVIILFWLMKKCSSSEYFVPIVTAISFAILLTIIPVNLNFLTQRNPIFLALTIAIPSFYFLINPNELKLKRLSFFLVFLCAFVSIGLIDLFTFCILIPPFILISVFLRNKNFTVRFWLAFGSFLLSIALVFGSYYIMSLTFQIDFNDFIRSNIISVNSYTYNPQLIIPINSLINYYTILAFGSCIVALYFIIILKENWNAALAFLLYFLFLVALLKTTNNWIDKDLVLQSMVVFFPIVIGFSVGIILRIVYPLTKKLNKIHNYLTAISSFIVVYFAIYLQRTVLYKITKPNDFSIQILDVYDKIHSNYFPYSFAVVDQNTTQIISENNHYFINYSEFLDSYLVKDATYFKYLKNHNYLKKNPQVVLPNSILLFIYNDENAKKIVKHLRVLKKRGRIIKLFQSNANFKVYEIINVPNSSKISDLIF